VFWPRRLYIRDAPCGKRAALGKGAQCGLILTAFHSCSGSLYSVCRIRLAMVINAVVISRSDPGAVPGASTNSRD
jgi:hypothetical protein